MSRQFKKSKFAISHLKKWNAQNMLKTKLFWKIIGKFFLETIKQGQLPKRSLLNHVAQQQNTTKS